MKSEGLSLPSADLLRKVRAAVIIYVSSNSILGERYSANAEFLG